MAPQPSVPAQALSSNRMAGSATPVFWLFQGVSKSVQVLFHGIEAVIALTLITHLKGRLGVAIRLERVLNVPFAGSSYGLGRCSWLGVIVGLGS